jgi:hypothetical protein
MLSSDNLWLAKSEANNQISGTGNSDDIQPLRKLNRDNRKDAVNSGSRTGKNKSNENLNRSS